jgi:hypothetical protein
MPIGLGGFLKRAGSCFNQISQNSCRQDYPFTAPTNLAREIKGEPWLKHPLSGPPTGTGVVHFGRIREWQEVETNLKRLYRSCGRSMCRRGKENRYQMPFGRSAWWCRPARHFRHQPHPSRTRCNQSNERTHAYRPRSGHDRSAVHPGYANRRGFRHSEPRRDILSLGLVLRELGCGHKTHGWIARQNPIQR